MNEIKDKISTRNAEWDVYKKYTNPYEYIHSVVPYKKKSVSKYKPLSRSYFKMIEIVHNFPTILCAEYVQYDPHQTISQSVNVSTVSSSDSKWKKRCPSSTHPTIQTFHLAEGPGGFIEAICNLRNNPDDCYTGMTILIDTETDSNVPAWKKSDAFLSRHPNVKTEPGADGTGDILQISNYEYCATKYWGSMDLITADGGFDFSKDFNHQEISVGKLLWAQICYAIVMQKQHGSFILKIFDCFYSHTVDILYILCMFYSEVAVCKLQTSRIGNSEKYVVCKGFRPDSLAMIHIYPILYKSFTDMHLCTNALKRMLSIDVPRLFTTRLEEMNTIFGQQQIENIQYTISLIDKTNRTDLIIRQNVAKCVKWCIDHNIAYNNLTDSPPPLAAAATIY